MNARFSEFSSESCFFGGSIEPNHKKINKQPSVDENLTVTNIDREMNKCPTKKQKFLHQIELKLKFIMNVEIKKMMKALNVIENA